MRRGNHDAIGQLGGFTLVAGQDCMRDYWRWRIASALLNSNADAVGNQHFHGSDKCTLRQGVGIHTDVERAGYVILLAIFN